MNSLPPDLIFEIAERAGIQMKRSGTKRPILCPFHEDGHPSAFLSASNVFFCSCCTPNGGWSAKKFATELGLDWNDCLGRMPFEVRPPPRPTWTEASEPAFDAADAQRTWNAAFARARNDDVVDEDRAIYDYLAQRGLGESFEVGAFGVMTDDSDLHRAVASWRRRGYSILAPLCDLDGRIVNVQSRFVGERIPKTLLPKGSTVSGTVFADGRGRALLRGEMQSEDRVLLGEGLSDMLALSVASPVPVLTAAGTSNAVAAIGPWARGREVLLALDCDAVGEKAAPAVAQAIFQHGGRRVRRVVWPARAKDACDVVARLGVVGLSEFLSGLLVEVAA